MPSTLLANLTEEAAVAVKQVRVSDLSGQQAGEEQFAKLIVHEHPQYQGPITLDVLPEEIGELPDSDQYVSIEVIQPGERSGQRALLSVDRFNKLAASGDMNSVLMNAVAEQKPQRPTRQGRRGRAARDGQSAGKGKVEWGLPHRGRISPEEAAYVREHLRGPSAAGSARRAAAGSGRPQDQGALRPVEGSSLCRCDPQSCDRQDGD